MPPKKRVLVTRKKGKRKGSNKPYITKKQRDTLQVEGQVSNSNAKPSENLPPKPRVIVKRLRKKKTQQPPMVIEILKVDATPRHLGRPRKKVSITEPSQTEIPKCCSSSVTGGSIRNSKEPATGKENSNPPSINNGLDNLVNVDRAISLQTGEGCQELSNEPVATSTMEISGKKHKDHDYCAAPDGNKKAQHEHSSSKNLQPENSVHFDVVESEINAFTSATKNDEYVSGDATGFIGPNPTLRAYPRSRCTVQDCLDEKKQLRSQIHDSIAAHYVSQTELGAARRELDCAREQLAALRAQLEENAQALCAYLSAGGVSITVNTENQ